MDLAVMCKWSSPTTAVMCKAITAPFPREAGVGTVTVEMEVLELDDSDSLSIIAHEGHKGSQGRCKAGCKDAG